jgi:hypothetical protein
VTVVELAAQLRDWVDEVVVAETFDAVLDPDLLVRLAVLGQSRLLRVEVTSGVDADRCERAEHTELPLQVAGEGLGEGAVHTLVASSRARAGCRG